MTGSFQKHEIIWCNEKNGFNKEKTVELLIIGNGFDLAHDLPTRYTDFLRYCKEYQCESPISDLEEQNEEFGTLIKNNTWLKYFLAITDLTDLKTWIDFEKEIGRVIEGIENTQIYFEKAAADKEIQIGINKRQKELNIFLGQFCVQEKKENSIDGIINFSCLGNEIRDEKSLIKFIYYELKRFTRAFEIYCLMVNNIKVDESIIDTERKIQMEKSEYEKKHYQALARHASGYGNRKSEQEEFVKFAVQAGEKYSELYSGSKLIDYLSLSKFDCVLSFNYTNTYERLYGNEKTKYCYIHGKAQEDKYKTNIILGIDDNLRNGEETKKFKCVYFKKYYQRILLKTGSEYKDWLWERQQRERINVYLVGHSLDRTDYEVLYEIFQQSNCYITVYYFNETDFNEKIQRVISLLSFKGQNGRDELIKRVHGKNWTIRFVDQYDKKDGLFLKPKESKNQ